MDKVFLGSIGILAIVAAFFVGRETVASTHHKTADTDLIDRVNALQVDKMCADQAYRAFRMDEARQTSSVDTYTSHYNSKLRRCFVLYNFWKADVTQQQYSVYQSLQDAFEGVPYGEFYIVHSTAPGDNKDGQITTCDLAPNGPKSTCHSAKEWAAHVQLFMAAAQPDL